jgi:hypothetical protein
MNMRKINTYKLLCAKEQLYKILGNDFAVIMGKVPEREAMYAWLIDHGYKWDKHAQNWRLRQPGTRGPSNRHIVKENSFVLIRVMARKEILDRDRDNYALAFEAIGYEIADISTPRKNTDNGFFRVYIKAKVS